jgi:hypothetical protein
MNRVKSECQFLWETHPLPNPFTISFKNVCLRINNLRPHPLTAPVHTLYLYENIGQNLIIGKTGKWIDGIKKDCSSSGIPKHSMDWSPVHKWILENQYRLEPVRSELPKKKWCKIESPSILYVYTLKMLLSLRAIREKMGKKKLVTYFLDIITTGVFVSILFCSLVVNDCWD